MDFYFKNSISTLPIKHQGAGTGKPDRPRLSGATPRWPTFIDSRSGELETATTINKTNITIKCLNSNMNHIISHVEGEGEGSTEYFWHRLGGYLLPMLVGATD